MAAANTDLVRNATPNFATNLTASMGASDTTMSVASTAGLATNTAVTLFIDTVDPNTGIATPSLREVVTGVVASSTSITNLLRGKDGTTAQSHANNAVVTQWISANLWNEIGRAHV